MKKLIVNADDLGLSAGANQGIFSAHECGIVTSASLMVRQPSAASAVEMAKQHPSLSVGLHLDLCEWIYEEDEWQLRYEVVPLTNPAAVAAEIERQLVVFRDLTGGSPTHIDSHQHVHRTEPIQSHVLRVASELRVPVRHADTRVRYCGEFYGQSDKGHPYHEGITVEAALKILRELPDGVTEMACHPAAVPESTSVYRNERVIEYETLCDPRLREALKAEKIELRSFRDFER